MMFVQFPPASPALPILIMIH